MNFIDDDEPLAAEEAATGTACGAFLTVDQLANRWQLSERHIRRLIGSGALAVHRFGKKVRIAVDDVLAFEQACR